MTFTAKTDSQFSLCISSSHRGLRGRGGQSFWGLHVCRESGCNSERELYQFAKSIRVAVYPQYHHLALIHPYAVDFLPVIHAELAQLGREDPRCKSPSSEKAIAAGKLSFVGEAELPKNVTLTKPVHQVAVPFHQPDLTGYMNTVALYHAKDPAKHEREAEEEVPYREICDPDFETLRHPPRAP